MSFTIEVKPYSELTADELADICRFRNKIYLEEGYLEEMSSVREHVCLVEGYSIECLVTEKDQPHLPDNTDTQSVHFTIKDGTKIVAYSRLITSLEPPEVSRFCVARDYRGHRTGNEPIFLLFFGIAQYSAEHNILNWQCSIRDRFFDLCQDVLNMDIKKKSSTPIFLMGHYSYWATIDLEGTLRRNSANPKCQLILKILDKNKPVLAEVAV